MNVTAERGGWTDVPEKKRFVIYTDDAESVDEDYKRLIDSAEDELRRAPSDIKTEAVALMTEGGGIYSASFAFDDYDAGERLIGALPDETVKKLVCVLQTGGLDMPSYEFRRALIFSDERNAEAEMLVFGERNGSLGLFSRTVGRTMAPVEVSLAQRSGEAGYTSFGRFVVDVVYAIIGEKPEYAGVLNRQFARAVVDGIRTFECGFYVDFKVADGEERLGMRETLTLGNVQAEIPGLQYGMGFILWIRDGVITSLEGYTYDESLALGSIAGYRLVYPEQTEE